MHKILLFVLFTLFLECMILILEERSDPYVEKGQSSRRKKRLKKGLTSSIFLSSSVSRFQFFQKQYP